MSKSSVVWTEQQYEEWCRKQGLVPQTVPNSHACNPPLKPTRSRSRKKTQAEQEYETILRLAHPESKVFYEAYTLKLAPDTRYTPDLAVVTETGMGFNSKDAVKIDFYEIKGRYIFAKALNKPKIAAAMFPHHRFFLASKTVNGWNVKQLMPQ